MAWIKPLDNSKNKIIIKIHKMKKNFIYASAFVLTSIFLASCKTSQPMFAGAVTAGWVLLGVSMILLVIVLKKFI